MAAKTFQDRADAGRALAVLLDHYRDRDDVVVLALPRGGVPVAYQVAKRLSAPLDVFVVRKLGLPRHPELAMGAIASGGVMVTNDDVLRAEHVDPCDLQRVTEAEGRELLRRERVYRDGAPPLDVAGKTVIVVDDGLATGATMRAALEALHRLEPARTVVAVPAASESSCTELRRLADEIICATTPTPFYGVGASYWDFDQTSDEEVRSLLAAASAGSTAVDEGNEVAIVSAASMACPNGVPKDEEFFEWVGDAQFVLIGEASHGTHEFYAARAAMTRRLIEEKGFCAVVTEADWPDAYRVNRYVQGRGEDSTPESALAGFERFPTWMWRNTVVVDFIEWLRARNDATPQARDKVGFFGMDLYSLYRSAADVIAYLDDVDPQAARRARERYRCFDSLEGDGQNYGFAAAFGAGQSCEDEVLEQLVDMQRHAVEHARRDGMIAEDEQFYAEQNARLVRAAEQYYRTMFAGRISSWNLRDQHMFDTVQALREHLNTQRGEPAKLVVWAHNSHLGDARATEMGSAGELNVGQLIRDHYADQCRIIGFSTYSGTVTAADDWGGTADRKQVRPALWGSIENFFHDVGQAEFWLRFDTRSRAAQVLSSGMLQRAIGVIYRPDTERQSHYFRARAAEQFDAIIHIDRTTALAPLERTPQWQDAEPPETYPAAV
ncbi:erythromycin esterase family protein [Rhodococcus sp. T7]|uniref:erythromycin esterase family protein n=1 Tax=Rhodococcus sp. T7 TaxID=627444 RepID=UPI00135B01F1|nr:erythromycin esterase family protein [Rhodococcus sp. T7]KAF0957374.1 hypothetical protein MLGJGCBP_09206 [Rhodococcus sp. T7]KAF0962155.1 hypothetical protein MLGJGCBP_04776 [Rhodococcus sp. T7]